MATVNFSVPDKVKEEFNRVFATRNKSQIIAELMMRAVQEEAARKRRIKAIDALVQRRSRRPKVSAAQATKARVEGRP